ncbi:MAG: hypothetical protein ACYSWP_05270 [Planctomycetota bacterium]
METDNCSHFWEMIDVTDGLIVFKKCYHCSKISSCFSPDSMPPVEPVHEQEHFWNFMESDEAFHFDLRCTKCGDTVKLGELVGLMMCTGCDETCQVDVLRRKLETDGKRVCIALGCRPIDERKQLPDDKFSALEELFNNPGNVFKSGIRIVPHKMVKNIDRCRAEVVKDLDMLGSIATGQ